MKVDEKESDLKGISQKRKLRDVLKDISYKPHALYYHSQKNKDIKNYSPNRLVTNTTITELFTTTDMTSTVYDIYYDENSTIGTEETFTTESMYTITDIENVTEVTLFEKNNDTIAKTDIVPKKTAATEDCSCNFLYKVCDINCCCDSDCLDSEINMFPNCIKNKSLTKNLNDYDDNCVSQLPYFDYGSGLFCIVSTNLPEKRSQIHQKKVQTQIGHFLTWKSSEKPLALYEFSNTIYKYGDPIWLLRNGTIYHTDLPTTTVNNYCTGRKAVQFLKEEKYSCHVKIHDLEMFQIIKSLDEVTVISATPHSINSSVLNCSSFFCVNWTIVVCNNLACTNYNKSLHEPICTESICTNLALKINYIFYYHDSKIINATIQFHLENMTVNLPLMSQEIQVKFVLGNRTINEILKLSGSPGYKDGLPIIISYAEKNYTETFYNSTVQTKHMVLPENQHGLCKQINNSRNYILFGKNRRIYCGYNHKYKTIVNVTDECKNIQNNIHGLLELNNKITVAPFGNPQQLKDEEWIVIEKSSLFEGPLYGGVQDQFSKLLCFNLITRYSLLFSYTNVKGHKRIISCKYGKTAKNVTFSMDDISTVVTIDISFIDVTKPSVLEYVTAPPNLNIHLPDDFFYPFHRNKSRILKYNVFTMILYFITIIS